MAHSKPPKARCKRTPFDEVECTIPFHAELITAWKDAVPYRRRSYDPDSKAWTFDSTYADEAIALLLRYIPDSEVPRRPRTHAKPTAPHVGADHFEVLDLLPTAPIQVVSAAYKALAKMHHPDLNGDEATMRRLTQAHDALSRWLRA